MRQSRLAPFPPSHRPSADAAPRPLPSNGRAAVAAPVDSARLLAALVQSAGDAIVGMNPEGTIVSWNRGAAQLYGYSPDEMLGGSIASLFPPERSGEFMDRLAAAAGAQAVSPCEATHLKRDRSRVRVSLALSPIRNAAGSVIGISAIARRAARVGGGLARRVALRELQQFSSFLHACQSLEEARSLLERSLRRLFPDCQGALFEWNADFRMLEASVVWGDAALREAAFPIEACWALRHGQLHCVADAAVEVACPHWPRRAASSMCAPLMAGGETIGVLSLQAAPAASTSGGSVPQTGVPARRRLVEAVAAHIALAWSNLRRHESLRRESACDALTGLWNRRVLDQALPWELHRASRRGASLALVLCDMDRFKLLNDRCGHAAGDMLLRAFGELVRGLVRPGDLACRYGGDEFALILPQVSPEGARRRAEQLREAFNQFAPRCLPAAAAAVLPALSLGVAFYPRHASTTTPLLRAADAALYQAKARGGDQVVLAAAAPPPRPSPATALALAPL